VIQHDATASLKKESTDLPSMSTADAVLEALLDNGSQYLFVNLGTDHTPLIEAIAKRDEAGQTRPRVILCPHESVALSMAHGYAQASGRPQTVLVHVDVGTQNLGGALHNIARTRVPVLILAGLAPVTETADQRGCRDMFVHWIQDLSDQAGIVRPYVKWEYEFRNQAGLSRSGRRMPSWRRSLSVRATGLRLVGCPPVPHAVSRGGL
jgi:acetolactate synthase I/II/III large subunit